MFRWLSGPGEAFKQALPGSTNYLNAYDRNGNLMRARNVGARKVRASGLKEDEEKEKVGARALPRETTEDLMPFPLNRRFWSQAVLSEELKDSVWKRVMEDGKSVRDVSAVLGVEMRRVAAVVRLKAVEKEWEKQGKPLAIPYARAIQEMLPKTPYLPNDPKPHEPINDLPVHRATELQIFHPVSESRHFTRRDAGKVFDRNLLPAEDRIPHPELVQLQKWRHEGIGPGERLAKQKEANALEQEKKSEAEKARIARVAREVKMAETGRSVFRFQDIKVESVGRNGRDRKGVGARYGIPHQDRKKGQIKIPTRVE